MSNIDKQLDENGILTLTINRPDKLNALSTEVLAELHHAFEKAQSDDEVKALLITGVGKAFCAGADIQRLAETNAQTGYEFAKYGQKVFRTLETLGKPTLAAVNGFAFGGGCELAMSATLRVASSTAQFGQPEVKLGVIPGYGGTQRLSRLVGKGRALDLCLTGRFISAEDALAWGLVSSISSEENLLSDAKNMLNSILKMAPMALVGVMNAIDRGFDMSLEDAMDFEALCFAKTCATDDKTEGVNAFLEKRSANFKGY